mmetsp:Transcript_11251/g.25632  ORF Transcript_11251/g.25632 Transcript_11251/m.25632 type:complete len:212 (-) Transcript_11251:3-638(-)
MTVQYGAKASPCRLLLALSLLWVQTAAHAKLPFLHSVQEGWNHLEADVSALTLVNDTAEGGTICDCQCGDHMVWRQEIFLGDVAKAKEEQCKVEVCPAISIPGLTVKTSCKHVDDVSKLIEGTTCDCACGEKLVWHQQRFHGDVVEERERECLQKICPVVNPLPGIMFKAECEFHDDLFVQQKSNTRSAARHDILVVSMVVLHAAQRMIKS